MHIPHPHHANSLLKTQAKAIAVFQDHVEDADTEKRLDQMEAEALAAADAEEAAAEEAARLEAEKLAQKEEKEEDHGLGQTDAGMLLLAMMEDHMNLEGEGEET